MHKLPNEILTILNHIKNNSNVSHYRMVEQFCIQAFWLKNIVMSKWDIITINKFYPELTNHDLLSKKCFEQIQDKLEFCKDSL